MSNYLLTWNPKITKWDTLDSEITKTEKKHSTNIRWSCGNTKSIRPGDLIVLMRLGIEPKGIVGLGYASSGVETTRHWREEDRLQGKTARSVHIDFVKLQKTPIIPLANLQNAFPSIHWTPQISGVKIDDVIAFDLFEDLIDQQFIEEDFFIEGAPQQATITRYDRNPVARQRCIDHYGYNCYVCEFNFAKKYGEKLGDEYIEVHHLKPLSLIGVKQRIDPVKDLRPVCANCHRMLHRKKQVISIEELVHEIRKASSSNKYNF